jgi:hypothetical protein
MHALPGPAEGREFTVRLRLKLSEYQKLAQPLGWDSDEKAAAAIGVDTTTVWRVRTGRTDPGQRFIAGLLAVAHTHGWAFEDLFELVPDDDGGNDGEQVA